MATFLPVTSVFACPTLIRRQAEHGLLELDEIGLTITPADRLLLLNVAMVFNQYLARAAGNSRFSQDHHFGHKLLKLLMIRHIIVRLRAICGLTSFSAFS